MIATRVSESPRNDTVRAVHSSRNGRFARSSASDPILSDAWLSATTVRSSHAGAASSAFLLLCWAGAEARGIALELDDCSVQLVDYAQDQADRRRIAGGRQPSKSLYVVGDPSLDGVEHRVDAPAVAIGVEEKLRSAWSVREVGEAVGCRDVQGPGQQPSPCFQ
jgi:hypothetical protein